MVSLVGAATSIPFAVTVFRSMAADPGCVIENEFDAMTNKFEADGSAMIHYEGDSSPSEPPSSISSATRRRFGRN